ncbi:hypothetical protein NKI48_17960 [Mesorhizobium sp. M0644]|uniref:rRNA adenine N-6-methyltransferase family protein n=1 Tax=Mesorhizobium sp. M0644 TaxID=2956979 RepID=UPI00333D47D4
MQIGAVHTSPSAALHEICHDVLVSLDEKRGLHSGLPLLWALVFDYVNIAPGQTVLQVGAGVGYFTAILAELTGSQGRVIAYEIDEELAGARKAILPITPMSKWYPVMQRRQLICQTSMSWRLCRSDARAGTVAFEFVRRWQDGTAVHG